MKAQIELKELKDFSRILKWNERNYLSEAKMYLEKGEKDKADDLLNRVVTVDITELKKDTLLDIKKHFGDNNEGKTKGFISKISEYLELLNGSDAEIKSLSALKAAIEANSNDENWVFIKEDDGSFMPFYVEEVGKKTEKDDYGSSTYVYLILKRRQSPFRPKTKDRWGDYGRNDEYQTKKIYFYTDNLKDDNGFLTLSTVLNKKGVVLYHESLKKEYDEMIEKFYHIIENEIGKVFITNSRCEKIKTDGNWWWGSSWDYLKTGGINHKLVIDINDDLDNIVIPHYSKKKMQIPIMPYLGVFNLHNHTYYYANANSLIEYEHNENAYENLVIPQEHKDIIDIFINDEEALSDDIVEGKSGGIITLCHGAPGLGKTLTAEITAEMTGRPLYKVHASQLGTNPEKIEENLISILRRSERMGSILLIDEADTYMRKRGTTIAQDAVVGVFLRLLEYYKGIMFLTTNLLGEIDDAILSRINIHVKYETPKDESLYDIFKIHLVSYKIDYDEKDLKKIVGNLNSKLSGRDVKNVCKNCAKIINRDKKVKFDMELINRVKKFMYLPLLKV